MYLILPLNTSMSQDKSKEKQCGWLYAKSHKFVG